MEKHSKVIQITSTPSGSLIVLTTDGQLWRGIHIQAAIYEWKLINGPQINNGEKNQ